MCLNGGEIKMSEETRKQEIIKILKEKINLFERLKVLTTLSEDEQKNYLLSKKLLNDLKSK